VREGKVVGLRAWKESTYCREKRDFQCKNDHKKRASGQEGCKKLDSDRAGVDMWCRMHKYSDIKRRGDDKERELRRTKKKV